MEPGTRHARCADCDEKAGRQASRGAPSGLPAETVGTTAAMWVSVGNLKGFGIGVTWAAQMVEHALGKARPRWLPARLSAAYERELTSTAQQLREHGAAKTAEAQTLESGAREAMTRLDTAYSEALRGAPPVEEHELPALPVKPIAFEFTAGIVIGLAVGALLATLLFAVVAK